MITIVKKYFDIYITELDSGEKLYSLYIEPKEYKLTLYSRKPFMNIYCKDDTNIIKETDEILVMRGGSNVNVQYETKYNDIKQKFNNIDFGLSFLSTSSSDNDIIITAFPIEGIIDTIVRKNGDYKLLNGSLVLTDGGENVKLLYLCVFLKTLLTFTEYNIIDDDENIGEITSYTIINDKSENHNFRLTINKSNVQINENIRHHFLPNRNRKIFNLSNVPKKYIK